MQAFMLLHQETKKEASKLMVQRPGKATALVLQDGTIEGGRLYEISSNSFIYPSTLPTLMDLPPLAEMLEPLGTSTASASQWKLREAPSPGAVARWRAQHGLNLAREQF